MECKVMVVVEAVDGDDNYAAEDAASVRQAIDGRVEGVQTFDVRGSEAPAGAKGWMALLNAIGVILLEAGAVKALFDCLVSMVRSNTEREIKIVIKAPPSQDEISLETKGLSQADLNQLLERLERMVGTPTPTPGTRAS